MLCRLGGQIQGAQMDAQVSVGHRGVVAVGGRQALAALVDDAGDERGRVDAHDRVRVGAGADADAGAFFKIIMNK